MNDPRLEKMAKGLIHYSVKLNEGEKILIEVIDSGIPLAQAIIKEVYKVGGIPFVLVRNKQLDRQVMLNCSQEQMKKMGEYELAQMRDMQAYLGIRGAENATETADVPGEKQQLYMKYFVRPVLTQRINHTKWCIMRYPNPSFAQSAGMSTEGFEDFYFDVCTLDYAKMRRHMEPLQELIARSDEVRILGPETELKFSIKGMPSVPCAGELNIPDGELYTSPVKESVEGVITYNTPAVYQGVTYDRVQLRFERGKIIHWEGSHPERLEQIFNTDEGARYVGEFAFGLNPYIMKPMKDTLFDEKISGSIHFTPGNAYEDCDNGNRSAIHWDLVLIQQPEYGGGEIYFDGRLIRKDGRFVIPELEVLNPENLR